MRLPTLVEMKRDKIDCFGDKFWAMGQTNTGNFLKYMWDGLYRKKRIDGSLEQ